MVGTYFYTNKIGLKKRLKVVKQDNIYIITIWSVDFNELTGIGQVNERELKNFLNSYPDMTKRKEI